MRALEIEKIDFAIRNYGHINTELNSGSSTLWSSIYKFARRNRIESCFNALELKKESSFRLSDKMISERRKILTLRENDLLEKQRKIHEAFEENDLFPLYYKGFGLSIDGRIPKRVRFYEDIDIIIDSSQANSYLKLLFSKGYKTKFCLTKVDPLAVLGSIGSLNLSNGILNHNIDLHITPFWAYFPQVLSYSDLLADSRIIEVGHSRYLLPSLVNHSLILLLEGTKDLWSRLDRVLDYYICYANLGTLELELFYRLIVDNKLSNMFDLANYLIFDILKFDENGLFLVEGGVESCREISKEVVKSWQSENGRRVLGEPFRLKAHLKLMDSNYMKISYLCRRVGLPTENDLKIFSLPTFAFSLFFIFRPARKLLCMITLIAISFKRRIIWC